MTEPLKYPYTQRDPQPVKTAPEQEPEVEAAAVEAAAVEEEQAAPLELPGGEPERETQPLMESPDEHAPAIEFEIPDGYQVLEGAPEGERRGVAVIRSE